MIDAYFPQDTWYDFYTGSSKICPGYNPGDYNQLAAPLDTINIHVRGGYILPMQEPALTTTLRYIV